MLMYWRLESRAVVFIVWPRLGALLKALGRWNIRRQVADPDLRAKLTPEYPPGCKRLLLSNDYYPALNRDNVRLVTDPVRAITATGVVTSAGDQLAVDAIILGTGFQATAPFPEGMITGSQGVDITERWRGGIEAYKGISVSGFPNFFMLAGPNTGLGHNSVVFMLEAQVGYIMQAVSAMESGSIDSLEVRPEIEAEFNRQLQRRLARTVWASGCRSWYLDANGRNVTLWPGFTVEYWFRTRRFRLEDYRVPAGSRPG
jgi:cation diffusion facilitator CzcD-associated flavoprotein CzcO